MCLNDALFQRLPEAVARHWSEDQKKSGQSSTSVHVSFARYVCAIGWIPLVAIKYVSTR